MMTVGEQKDLSDLIDGLTIVFAVSFILMWIDSFYRKVKKQLKESAMKKNKFWEDMYTQNRLNAKQAEKQIHASCYNGYRSTPPK